MAETAAGDPSGGAGVTSGCGPEDEAGIAWGIVVTGDGIERGAIAMTEVGPDGDPPEEADAGGVEAGGVEAGGVEAGKDSLDADEPGGAGGSAGKGGAGSATSADAGGTTGVTAVKLSGADDTTELEGSALGVAGVNGGVTATSGIT
jgi:hypothetical protein